MPQKFERIASVLIDKGIDQALDYGVDSSQIQHIHKGSVVEVPLRGRSRKGFVLDLKETSPFKKILAIQNIHEQSLPQELFDLALWISRYYLAPLGKVLHAMLPPSVSLEAKTQLFVSRNKSIEELRQACAALRGKFPAQSAVLEQMLRVKKGIFLTELLEKCQLSKSPVDSLIKKKYLKVQKVVVERSPLKDQDYFPSQAKTLNEEQKAALEKITSSIQEKTFQTHLLFGVTGSGKTEVYMQAIDQALLQNLDSILLVPEISLTPQTVERFQSRFGKQIAVLHHRLSAGERSDEWQRIRNGHAKIVIGARSAIFSPVQNLGLIIVDEEHESSYKQSEESPCYHARDLAIVRAQKKNACVVLGSATPSIESFYNAKEGKYLLSKLEKRADRASIPSMHLVNMGLEQNRGAFSTRLKEEIQKRLDAGEQSILFLNRRGYYSCQICDACQMVLKCPYCDVAMTYHFGEKSLSCHLCSHTITPPPTQCPYCKHSNVSKYRGIGTEQIQRSLHAIFPGIRTLRMDADTTRHKGSHEKILSDFRKQKADLLIGTQMIAKGLHFPQVTLVGIINADASLNIPDFRASERAFQLLTQVAGRAGRGLIAGQVIIQSRMPENRVIQLASNADYESFFADEIHCRKLFNFPPFCRMIKCTFSGSDEEESKEIAEQFQRDLKKRAPKSWQISDTLPAGYAKIKERFRFQFLAKGHGVYQINQEIAALRKNLSRKVKLCVDIDPLSTFF